MSSELEGSEDVPKILHVFADYGTESEILSWYGDVVRIGIDARDLNDSEPITADAHVLKEDDNEDEDEDEDRGLPIKDDVIFDLGVFHPVCSKWAATTSISGDPDDHVNMIPSARYLADKYTDHYVIENVPKAPLRDPVVLNGKMFGLPIEYERAFETNFHVPQPPQYKRFWGRGEDESETAETSSFFFTERSRKWWASVKGYLPGDYPKQHLAKNTIPAPYFHHILRAWLRLYEDENGIDYSDYDERMEVRRRVEANRTLGEYGSESV
ncbi:hypothetical protein Hrd1104_00175 [Halorhabdus sp. CBA1104]|uniref:hypothetical protein n=1 Tax=Halorhabdus sp. CBA1104 TaxID=1380432 RepID=UPI0012B426A5|nr:hypothetical protein [Halorhabdus sp. CBA1104]QGN05859.1 hypothetical protein Hrd1104_00175 [Halorhabdus sp. CBA1104]